ncbi:serine protease inhibitor Kazal-type 9-like isoform X6 [Antechinus flavipes]|uniref:serine protease inhibitor Kazal-type 9-like isoform X6 n=1 Tax=Antechinus flavipes TaxID=38775 RepID=UPI002235DF42|nr:serine protease inhibitor Kazal-type 9-like isoform X6 [Antechinus flavipes]
MAFSLLLNKAFFGLFIIASSGFSDFINWKKPKTRKAEIDCLWLLQAMKNNIPRIWKYCEFTYDPLCSKDKETFGNQCLYCLKYRNSTLKIHKLDFGEC